MDDADRLEQHIGATLLPAPLKATLDAPFNIDIAI
jgi:hypothetical protein